VINSLKVPVPFDYVFPHGLLGLSVAPLQDFDKRGQADDQARDKDTGERVWALTGLDLDPNAARFGRDKVRIKIVASVLPVLPDSAVPGYPPSVELVGLVLVPYVDQSKCKPAKDKECRARLAYSMRADGVTAPGGARSSKAA
jgi:hypothetical protein